MLRTQYDTTRTQIVSITIIYYFSLPEIVAEYVVVESKG